jgi:hypothetical protein
MRRRRSSRSNRKNDKISAASVVLLLVVAAVFIYVFQVLDIFNILFGPSESAQTSAAPTITLSSPALTPGASASAKPTGTADAATGGRTTEEIKMNSISLYGVQLGVFSKEENAQSLVAKYKPEGAAGYVLKEEGLFRVLDSVYYNQNDAKGVRDTYKNGSATDACLLRVEVSGVNWKVSATKDQIQAIRSAITVMQSQIVILIDTQKKAQQKTGTAEDYKAVIKTSAQKFNEASTSMMNALGPTNSPVIKKLNDSLKENADSLNALADTDSTDTVALMSGLKYNIIDILLKLEQKLMS